MYVRFKIIKHVKLNHNSVLTDTCNRIISHQIPFHWNTVKHSLSSRKWHKILLCFRLLSWLYFCSFWIAFIITSFSRSQVDCQFLLLLYFLVQKNSQLENSIILGSKYDPISIIRLRLMEHAYANMVVSTAICDSCVSSFASNQQFISRSSSSSSIGCGGCGSKSSFSISYADVAATLVWRWWSSLRRTFWDSYNFFSFSNFFFSGYRVRHICYHFWWPRITFRGHCDLTYRTVSQNAPLCTLFVWHSTTYNTSLYSDLRVAAVRLFRPTVTVNCTRTLLEIIVCFY